MHETIGALVDLLKINLYVFVSFSKCLNDFSSKNDPKNH